MTDPDLPWTIHKNGGGRVGRFVTISPGTYVRADSTVGGHCEIYGDEILIQQESRLTDWCRLSGESVCANSDLSGFVNLTNSKALYSRLSGDIWAVDSEISRSELTALQGQQSRIISSQLNGVTAYGPVFVQNAKIENCELLPLVRILGGEWIRSPRILRTSTMFHLVESHEPDSILIGCLVKTIEQWKRLASTWIQWKGIQDSASTFVCMPEPITEFQGFSPEEITAIAIAIRQW